MLSSAGIIVLAGVIVGFCLDVVFLILLVVVVSTCIVVIGILDGVSIYSLLVVFNVAFQAGYLSGVVLNVVVASPSKGPAVKSQPKRYDARECRRAIQTAIAQGLQEQITVPRDLPRQMVVLLLRLDQHRDTGSGNGGDYHVRRSTWDRW
jgi:hypothetical protein